jgi:tetratricopeptide (TPR) repeat protein/tRNA A-37 threonylcarbamoyl transferase component Bud32
MAAAEDTVKSLFFAALDKEPAERSTFLDSACQGDDDLRRRVEALLHAAEAADPLLDHPAAYHLELPTPQEFTTPHPSKAEGPDRSELTRAGHFRLEGEIARGGMGAVYRAIDTALGREVAVKVLQEKFALDSGIAQRFKTEARITGQLQHPAIPPVHAVGTLPDGRPFLAMKLIKGSTLDQLLRQRTDCSAERGRFLAIFEQVCQAVAYAHIHQVIHRDLKPANVMVGGFGEVQVMDWGLAKILAGTATVRGAVGDPEATTAETVLRDPDTDEGEAVGTQAGSIMGTWAYMAPEQAAGEKVDPRSDVFGLGAILAVILTGAPPYQGRDAESVRVMAIRGDLAACYGRLEGCGAEAELVALCRRCLAFAPEERPADAGEVARAVAGLRAAADERAQRAELDRVKAEGEVREAEARMAEQRRRRRMLLTASGIIALVLLAGLSVSLWLMQRAMQAEAAATTNAQQALEERDAKAAALAAEQKAREDETKARQQAFDALRSVTAEVVEKKFTQGTVLTEDDRAFLRGIIAQFDAFAAIKGDDADSRAVRAMGRYRVGVIRDTLGELKEAKRDYDQAVSIQKQLAADFPTRADYRQDLGRSLNNRGILLRSTGRFTEAEKDYAQALSIRKQLVADFPTRAEYREDLAGSHNNRSLLLRALGRPQEAEKESDQAMSIQERLAADFPTRAEFRYELAKSHNNRGVLLREEGRGQEAERHGDQAVSIYKQLAADFPTRPEYRQELAGSHLNRSVLLVGTGRLKEAEKDVERAMSLQKQLAADFPSRPEFRQELARSHNSRANLLRSTNRIEEAEKECDLALGLQKQLAADFPTRAEYRQELAGSHLNRGILLRSTGRSTEAVKDYTQAVRIQKQLAADFPNQPDRQNELAGTCVNLAILHLQLGNWPSAKRLLLEGRPHHLTALKAKPQHPLYRQFYHNHLNILTVAHAALLESEGAVRTAETVRDRGWDAPADAYDAAVCLSRCVRVVSQHDKLDAGQRKEAARLYGDAAMKLLREAVSKGFKDAMRLRKDPYLAPLRQREDFRKLVAEVEGKGK